MTDRDLIMIARPGPDGTPPADKADADRWGYCSQCGRVFPEGRPGAVRGTRARVRRTLMPRFTAHYCAGTGEGP